jgi:hypothetical protein
MMRSRPTDRRSLQQVATTENEERNLVMAKGEDAVSRLGQADRNEVARVDDEDVECPGDDYDDAGVEGVCCQWPCRRVKRTPRALGIRRCS